MNINSACILEDRGILFMDGEDAKDFLQNIITNDINKVSDANSCFASLLTPQGKFLFDFLVIKHKKGYFIDCEKIQIDDLFKQLSLYKLRSNVQILNLSNEFAVVALSYEKFNSIKSSKDALGFTIKYPFLCFITKNSNKNFPWGVSSEAKQELLSLTLFISLVIIFCKKSLASTPSMKRIPRSSKIQALLIFIFDC